VYGLVECCGRSCGIAPRPGDFALWLAYARAAAGGMVGPGSTSATLAIQCSVCSTHREHDVRGGMSLLVSTESAQTSPRYHRRR